MLNHEIYKTWSPAGIYTTPFLFRVYNNGLSVHEDWHCEIMKYADDTVMIEKPNTHSEDKILFQMWSKMNHLDCNYTKTKFFVFEKKSEKRSKMIFTRNIAELFTN